MNKLFWGFFFTFLNINLTLGSSSTLNLLPDWVGYILLLLGCRELLEESDLFARPRPWCIGMAVYTGLLWLWGLRGDGDGLFPQLLSLAAALVGLWLTKLIIDAIANMEQRRDAYFGSQYLYKVWKVSAICSVASYVLLILAPMLAILSLLAGAVAGIIFLVAVHRARKAYYQQAGV